MVWLLGKATQISTKSRKKKQTLTLTSDAVTVQLDEHTYQMAHAAFKVNRNRRSIT